MNNEFKKRKRGRYNAWKFDSNLEIPSSTRYRHQKRLVSHQEQNYNSVQMHLANSPQNVTSQPQFQNNISNNTHQNHLVGTQSGNQNNYSNQTHNNHQHTSLQFTGHHMSNSGCIYTQGSTNAQTMNFSNQYMNNNDNNCFTNGFSSSFNNNTINSAKYYPYSSSLCSVASLVSSANSVLNSADYLMDENTSDFQ